jgi:hypothetical protein
MSRSIIVLPDDSAKRILEAIANAATSEWKFLAQRRNQHVERS